MRLSFKDTTIITIGPHHRLQWEDPLQQHDLLYPEGMIKINDSAAEILKLCNGSLNAQQIISALQVKYPEMDIIQDIEEFLGVAYQNGWIVNK